MHDSHVCLVLLETHVLSLDTFVQAGFAQSSAALKHNWVAHKGVLWLLSSSLQSLFAAPWWLFMSPSTITIKFYSLTKPPRFAFAILRLLYMTVLVLFRLSLTRTLLSNTRTSKSLFWYLTKLVKYSLQPVPFSNLLANSSTVVILFQCGNIFLLDTKHI